MTWRFWLFNTLLSIILGAVYYFLWVISLTIAAFTVSGLGSNEVPNKILLLGTIAGVIIVVLGFLSFNTIMFISFREGEQSRESKDKWDFLDETKDGTKN